MQLPAEVVGAALTGFGLGVSLLKILIDRAVDRCMVRLYSEDQGFLTRRESKEFDRRLTHLETIVR